MDEALSAQAKWMAPTRQSEVDCGLLTLRPTQGHCPRETPDSISDPVGTFWPRHHARGSGKAEGSEPEPWFSTWTSFHWGVSLWGIRKYTEGVPGVGWSEDPRRLYLKWDLEVPALQRSQREESKQMSRMNKGLEMGGEWTGRRWRSRKKASVTGVEGRME